MLMCDILEVGRSGYYDWLKAKPGNRTIANGILDNNIKSIYYEHKMRYGAPRITDESAM